MKLRAKVVNTLFNSKKMSNQLMINYILFLIVFILMLFLSLTIVFSYYILRYDTEFKNKILAQDIIKEDYRKIKGREITKNGGFIEVIDNSMKVIKSEGSNKKGGYKYSYSELQSLLSNANKDNKYFYSYEISKNKDFTLLIALPKNFSYNVLTSTYVINRDSTDGKITKVKKSIYAIIITVFLISTIILYSKLTSRTFVKPLELLLIGVNKVKNGDYSARVKLESRNEIGDLAEAFNLMTVKIQEEVDLREKSEANRKRMVLDISHDLKNPLTSILGYSEYLLKHENIDELEEERLLKIINNNTKRANDLIDDLFQFSQVEDDAYMLNCERGDICEFLREIIADNIPMMEEKGINYEFYIEEKSIFIDFDKKKLYRAINNIMLNAIKYNEKGVNIKVSLEELKKKIKIVIEDNGIGIPREFHENIFEPFVRVDSARNSKTGGTGLGLAITKKIIEKHKGEVFLDHKISGCKFVIYLRKL
ncbi:sensor histidine kinase [Hathewaya massiliensis]|uniref:sensor histidine kinase n=1 Tax=Hathewaya massiliensis TaxID=1964382 RepID=UPI0011599E08|nr:HAMP domain-containing sensor histidine kinase [Hathewaya massiliensis]